MTPLTIHDLLMESADKRAQEFPPTTQMLANADNLLKQINALQEIMNIQFSVSSGYRPGPYNKAARGAANSPHLTCEAIDLHDEHGIIKYKLQSNQIYLITYKLYMETPSNTPTWCHLQTRPTHSRIFIP